jgi:hypothetical protein
VYNEKTSYVAREFGAAPGVISILMAVYFWKQRDEVEAARTGVTFFCSISAPLTDTLEQAIETRGVSIALS